MLSFLVVAGLLLMLLNATAARFGSARFARITLYASTASPAILLVIYLAASTSVWSVEDVIHSGVWAVVMLIPATVGVGTSSLLGQFFGKLAKGDFV